MNETPNYVEFHPRVYRPKVPTFWWLRQWSYLKFMLRELSSVFVALFVVITLLEVRALNQGPEAFAAFQARLASSPVVVLSVISFAFVLLHTCTWFNLTPRAMVVRLGGKRLPDLMVIAPNYVAWLVISGVIAWIVLGG